MLRFNFFHCEGAGTFRKLFFQSFLFNTAFLTTPGFAFSHAVHSSIHASVRPSVCFRLSPLDGSSCVCLSVNQMWNLRDCWSNFDKTRRVLCSCAKIPGVKCTQNSCWDGPMHSWPQQRYIVYSIFFLLWSTYNGFVKLTLANGSVQLLNKLVEGNWNSTSICQKYNISIPDEEWECIDRCNTRVNVNSTVSKWYIHPFPIYVPVCSCMWLHMLLAFLRL